MPRVAFVLRSTEVHPDCDELCHTKRKPVPLIEDSTRHVGIFFLSPIFQIDKHELNANFFRCGFSEKLKIERKGKKEKRKKGKKEKTWKKGKNEKKDKRTKGQKEKRRKGEKEKGKRKKEKGERRKEKKGKNREKREQGEHGTSAHPPTHHVSLSLSLAKF